MKLTLLSFAFVLVSFLGHAQDMKIGVADEEYILNQMPESKAAQDSLMAYQQQLSSRIQTKGQNLQQQYEAYQQASSTMTDDAKAKKEQELQALQQEVQQEQQQAQQLLQQKYAALYTPIREKVTSTIKKVAQANKYTHVFAKNVGGSLVTLYNQNEGSDISDLVLKEMGITPTTSPANANSGNNGNGGK